MLAVQARVLDLLKEIDEICSANGIKYSLAGRTAAMQAEAGGWVGDDYCAEIMMTPDNFAKFEKVFEKLGEKTAAENGEGIGDMSARSLEHPGNNPKTDGIYARYTDLNTTLLDFKRGANVRDRGIFVKIYILRSKAAKSRLDKVKEAVVAKNSIVDPGINKRYAGKKEGLKLSGLKAARAAFGGAGAMKKYFAECTADDGKSKNYFYKDGDRKFAISRKLLDSYKRVEFEGIELSVVEKSDEMLKKMYADGIAKELKGNRYPANEWGVYIDTENSFTDVEAEAKTRGIDFARLAREKADYDEFSSKEFSRRQRAADVQFRQVWRTINRFRLLELYKGREEEIKKAYADGRIDEVRAELADYIEMIENYEKKKMGFSYDRELYNIACEIMIKDGKEKIVKKSRSYMPEEFKEDLADFLKKEGYNE